MGIGSVFSNMSSMMSDLNKRAWKYIHDGTKEGWRDAFRAAWADHTKMYNRANAEQIESEESRLAFMDATKMASSCCAVCPRKFRGGGCRILARLKMACSASKPISSLGELTDGVVVLENGLLVCSKVKIQPDRSKLGAFIVRAGSRDGKAIISKGGA